VLKAHPLVSASGRHASATKRCLCGKNTGAWKTEGNTSGKSDGFVYTAPVGSFTPIENRLFDMNGNAWEWCMDFADDGRRHVLRGGSWRSPELRPPVRDFTLPAGMIGDVGFRCLLVTEVSWQ
jgi:formylglycine-generating enzyme required for sulfatase activity